MRLIPVDPSKLKKYRRSKWQEVIDEFLAMDVPAAKIETDKPKSAAASCVNAIKRFGYADVDCGMVNGETYIIRPSKVDK